MCASGGGRGATDVETDFGMRPGRGVRKRTESAPQRPDHRYWWSEGASEACGESELIAVREPDASDLGRLEMPSSVASGKLSADDWSSCVEAKVKTSLANVATLSLDKRTSMCQNPAPCGEAFVGGRCRLRT